MLLLNPPPTEPPPTFCKSFLAVAKESLHIGHADAALTMITHSISISSIVRMGLQRLIMCVSRMRRIRAGGRQHPVNDNARHGNVKPDWKGPDRNLAMPGPLPPYGA